MPDYQHQQCPLPGDVDSLLAALDGLPDAFATLLAGKARGRFVVNVR